MVAVLLLSGMTVWAATGTQNISVAYRNINLYVDGSLITPKDANGNVVEPFIYNGTTYLPVRAVGEALNKPVDWDGSTNTVYIGNKPNNPPPQTSTVSYYVEDENLAVVNSEYYPVIALYSDNTFTMIVNLYEGMGRLTGTYQAFEDSYRFTVLNGNFRGFIGDDVDSFTMLRRSDGSLQLVGDTMGATENGAIFKYSQNMPISFQNN